MSAAVTVFTALFPAEPILRNPGAIPFKYGNKRVRKVAIHLRETALWTTDNVSCER